VTLIVLNLDNLFQLSKLLIMDPLKRITSEHAKNDPYFFEEPQREKEWVAFCVWERNVSP